MLRADHACAYPVVDGFPILLAPEVLLPPATERSFDVSAAPYQEAYEELDYYNAVAEEEDPFIGSSSAMATLKPLLALSPEKRHLFPEPRDISIDAVYDSAAQWDAYAHLAPFEGKVVLQVGGRGIHAVKFLLAGASEAWAMSPMLEEVKYAMALGRLAGVEERLHGVVGIAEEMPFRDEMFDAVYSGGCVHHMVTELALPECARILKAGGRFSAIDPWRTPLYAAGTTILGKRERNVHCRPLTNARVRPLLESFAGARVLHHGAITRYPLLALDKFGISSSLGLAWRLNAVDDAVSSVIPALRRTGSSVALLAEKQAGCGGSHSAAV
jgi:SAM-dependent methyltransferase